MSSRACSGLTQHTNRTTKGPSATQQKIIPNLWFDGNAEEAAAFSLTVFDNARVITKTLYPRVAPGRSARS